MGWVCYFFSIPMASFQDFKDNILSWVIVGAVSMVWYDIQDMKTKIDTLIQLTSESKARIDGLEREVYKTGSVNIPKPPYKLPLQVKMIEVVGIRPEQDNKVRKYLTKI